MAHFTIYTYRYLLASAQRAYLRAHDKDDELVECMNVILFSALALEAFLNHLGARTVQSWPPLKRKLAPPQKLKFILAQHRVSVDLSRPPYQSFATAFQFRNLVAHAETEHVAFEKTADARHPPEAGWQTYCKLPIAERILKDVVVIFRTLPGQLGLHDEAPGYVLAEEK
ncbi:MAG: hypothetical protein WDO56_25030 [Gammaproteobacteria bacterium]